MKMLLTSENFESFSGVWFNIVYNGLFTVIFVLTPSFQWALFPMKFSSTNAYESMIWPTLTQSLQCRAIWLVTAAQWINCYPTIQYFHSCAPIWCSTWLITVQAMHSMLYMSSKLNNRDTSTSSICSIFCIFFCIFKTLHRTRHRLRGLGPSTSQGLNYQEKQYQQLRDLGVYWYVKFAYCA